MATIEVSRTLVKSPPELWGELQGERLREAVGATGLTSAEDERLIEWEADGARGTARLEPAGWGTKLTLTATVEEQVRELEPEVARLGLWSRLLRTRPEAPPPPPAPSGPTPDELEASLEGLLDSLGAAHRKPFQG